MTKSLKICIIKTVDEAYKADGFRNTGDIVDKHSKREIQLVRKKKHLIITVPGF